MKDFVKQLRDLIGKPSTDPEVEQFLEHFGIKERPTLEEDDYSAYLDEPARGFSLIFKNQPHLDNPKYKKGKKDVLILTGCHFYSEGYQEHSQFIGPLPSGLEFKHARKDVLMKLGDSSWQNTKDGVVQRERWEDGDHQLNIEYVAKETGIAIVYFGIREFFTRGVEAEAIRASQGTHAANSQARLAAYCKLFGAEPSATFTFADLDYPIEVLVFPLEFKGKPLVAAATSGMSDQRMVGEEEDDAEWSRREIIQYLPQCDEAHARRLRDVAWLPLFDGFFLDSHHTIGWPDAAVPGSPWKNAFFLEPLNKSHRNFRFKIADDEASFLWHIPISDEEYAYKKEHGSNALLDRLDKVKLPWIFDETNRPPLV